MLKDAPAGRERERRRRRRKGERDRRDENSESPVTFFIACSITSFFSSSFPCFFSSSSSFHGLVSTLSCCSSSLSFFVSTPFFPTPFFPTSFFPTPFFPTPFLPAPFFPTFFSSIFPTKRRRRGWKGKRKDPKRDCCSSRGDRKRERRRGRKRKRERKGNSRRRERNRKRQPRKQRQQHHQRQHHHQYRAPPSRSLPLKPPNPLPFTMFFHVCLISLWVYFFPLSTANQNC
mmetsp:Transcript_474/g.807  ORF Transcript_474/g.807 Transcript_474/m.807 type:complete len:231 (+) Transcript_474:107-799(+)